MALDFVFPSRIVWSRIVGFMAVGLGMLYSV